MALDNWWLMGLLDVFFISVAVIAIYTMKRHWKAIELAGAQGSFRLFSIGLSIWASHYVLNLLILLLGPVFTSDDASVERLIAYSFNYRSGVEVISFGVMLIGFIGLLSRFDNILDGMKKSSDSLEVELNSHSAREQDLKVEVNKQRVSERSKSEFLFKISHELRAPLNGVLGLTALLANTDLKAEQRKLLGSLERSAQGMLSRVNELLDMLRLESGRVEVGSAPFNPIDLASASHALFSPLAYEKGLTFTVSNSTSAEQNVIGDEKLTKQIVTNLLSNAIKYTQSGSVQLITEVSASDEGYLWLSYSVLDTGVGIASEEIANLFTPSAEDNALGRGMGLSICWQLAALMGGDVSVESELEKGSAFTARLRVQPALESSEA